MATKLCQIIAVEKGVKSKANREFTDIHHTVQKAALLSGLTRSYQPKDDEGEVLLGESSKVQVNAEDALKQASVTLTRLFDVTATKDWANTEARADVVVDGTAVLRRVPVTYLLFLEKQLTDLHTFVAKLPVLDAAETWTHDATTNSYKSHPAVTNRSKKVYRNHVKAEATDKHPAQVEVYTEDVTVGQWTTTKFSGALPQTRVNELVERVDKLHAAVKFAREEANQTEIADQHVGEAVFAYLLG